MAARLGFPFVAVTSSKFVIVVVPVWRFVRRLLVRLRSFLKVVVIIISIWGFLVRWSLGHLLQQMLLRLLS